MILVIGATGTVGTALCAAVVDKTIFRLALRDRRTARPGFESVPFDLARPATYAPALVGISSVFLLVPPQLADRGERIDALLRAAKRAGIAHIVFLSVRNADRLPFLPHRQVERAIEASSIGWTHLRPNDFMQNFATVPAYRDAIRDYGALWSPAGRAMTSYVDVRDVGSIAVKVLVEAGHASKAYTLTGPAALDLADVAAILSRELARDVCYVQPSLLAFLWHARRAGASWPLAAVMTGIGLVARSGLAQSVDPTLPMLLGRKPRTFGEFAHDYAAAWARQ